MNRRVESEMVSLERMRVATNTIVALYHEHPASGCSQQRRGRKPAEPTADYDRVVAIP
jgi:hypothetical protein